ncbi:MAG TPA: hypothetical protein DCZ94_16105 [Lentisphaeria bacterium]|nr:MAG: hypothetical protein A2X48_00535 [Lentisphaerae bacterium GWF2_49_21]HBC88472.1 hypothetical protein [Lentisphaeria bacterium]
MKKALSMIIVGALIFFLQGGLLAASYPNTSELEYRSHDGMPYRLFIPKNYDQSKSYTLVVFLHGSGEVGSDNEAQLKNNGNGSLWLINTDYQVSHPVFFAAPQGSWGNAAVQAKVAGMINALKQEFSGIATDRVIVTGLSLGGAGTYFMMSKYPDLVAAGVPMQGPKDWQTIANNKNMNIWHFHAADDNSGYHPISQADYTVKYLRSYGLNVVYTRYNTGGHGIWPEAYKNPQLMSWIYAARKGVKTEVSPFLKIKSPAETDTFSTSLLNLSLSGVAGNAETNISKVEWKNSRGGTGAVTGTGNWSVGNVPVVEGENVVQIIATGTSWSTTKGGNTTFNDALIVNSNPNGTVNKAPVANAGVDQSIQLPEDTVHLQGNATDDGQPSGTLSYSWNIISGPGPVVFADVDNAITTATISVAGKYVLSLTVSDGELSDSDEVEVTFSEEPVIQLENVALNKPVAVDSIYNATYIGANAVDGNKTDVNSRWLSANNGEYHWIEIDLEDDYEISELRLWSGYKTSGYAIQNYWFQAWNGNEWVDIAVRQNNSSQQTVDIFNPVVSGIVRLVCGNEDLARLYEIEVYGVPHVAVLNQKPVVNAGDDQFLTWPGNTVNLAGTATDDGLPSGSLTYLWSKISGPGAVSFSSPALDSSAQFAAPGKYVLQLTVSDGELSSSDQIIIWVMDNICLNKPVTADSVYNATYLASKAVDGDKTNTSSRWLSANNGMEHWIEIDLQGEYMVNRMKLWTGYVNYGYAVKNFRLQAWRNNSWEDVVVVSGNTSQFREESFAAIVTGKVRLLCGSDDMARVYEIEVFGTLAN